MVYRLLLQGGLGNQLFQVSAGLYLGQVLGQKVIFDSTLLTMVPKKIRLRDLEVGWLLDSKELIKGSWTTAFFMVGERSFSKFTNKNLFSKFISREINSNDDILKNLNYSGKILSGYFQNYQYAEASWSQLQDKVQSRLVSEIPEEFKSMKYIAIHIRAGDYLSNDSTRQIMGLTGFNYFKQALEILRKSLNIKNLVIVTDTPCHVSQNIEEFKGFKTKVVSSENIYTDLSIISRAKGVVMSNSSFSWWGAFIADKTLSAQIVAPKPWFNGKITEPKELIPKHWTVLERDIFQ